MSSRLWQIESARTLLCAIRVESSAMMRTWSIAVAITLAASIARVGGHANHAVDMSTWVDNSYFSRITYVPVHSAGGGSTANLAQRSRIAPAATSPGASATSSLY